MTPHHFSDGLHAKQAVIPAGTAGNVTGTVAVANGGTGATSLTANNVLLGNGTRTVATGVDQNRYDLME